MNTKLSTKGQLIIPKEVRQNLGWTPGTEIEVEQDRDRVVLRRVRTLPPTTLKDVIGCAGYKGPPRSLEDMEAAIAEGVRSKTW
jgi:AbrB family looped-hinge helix DNA binding protein